MPDITKCRGEDCNLKDTCWRHRAPSDFRQSYFYRSPQDEEGFCQYYWPDEEEIKKKRLQKVKGKTGGTANRE